MSSDVIGSAKNLGAKMLRLGVSRQEKERFPKEMWDCAAKEIEIWQRVNRLAILRSKDPKLYERQKSELLSQENLPFLIKIAEETSDDTEMRKEAIITLRRVEDDEVRISLQALVDNGMENEVLRMEARKSLIWKQLQ
ncbi:MAG: hypothetical protein QW112_03835 [Candidatus Micrarchaeia archaeon]